MPRKYKRCEHDRREGACLDCLRMGRKSHLCTHGRNRTLCPQCVGMTVKINAMFISARMRAKRDGIIFDITRADIAAMVGDGRCPVFGTPYSLRSSHGPNGGSDDSATLDRFVPDRGYTTENCAVISKRANNIKSNATIQQIRHLLTWMEGVTKVVAQTGS